MHIRCVHLSAAKCNNSNESSFHWLHGVQNSNSSEQDLLQASGQDDETEASAHEQFSNAMLTFHEGASRQVKELEVGLAYCMS